MSGLAGVCYLDGRPVDRADLERMVESIAHRGPDGSGVWNQGPVGLGHRMLWTTPESLQETLPLVNETGDLALTADARLDNRDDLIPALGLNGRPRDEVTDGEIILRAYEQWGNACPQRLLGDFAFAIWDRRRQMVFCARDHFGVKPFYYYASDRLFAFASEIKALLRLPEVPRRLNETRVADYLVPILEDKAITFYQDIWRLPPTHFMIAGPEGVQHRAYWALDPSRELRLGSDEEYAEAFRDLFTEAVRCRLRSAFPVGSLLSGGLDSSSIVCVARNLLAGNGGGRLHTFSAVFDDVPECDERPFIQAVLAREGLAAHYVRGDRLSPLADLERVFDHEDEPFYAPNLFLHWGLYGAARHQGVRVLLDGFDGDTTVSHGIARLAELASNRRWACLATEVIGLSRSFKRSSWAILLNHALKPLAPEPIRKIWRKLRGRNGSMGNINPIIQSPFATRIGLERRVHALQGSRSKAARTVREDHWYRLKWGIFPFALEVTDRAAAAFEIEPRYPFFDRRLAEFCLALPPEQKLSQGWTRIVLRRAMAGMLPAEVQWRGGKSDLSQNFIRALACERASIERCLLDDRRSIEPYIDLDAALQALDRFVSRHEETDALAVWKVLTLTLWLRRTGLAR